MQIMKDVTIENTLQHLKDPIILLLKMLNISEAEFDYIQPQLNDTFYIKWDPEVIKSKDSSQLWSIVAEYIDAAGINPFEKLSYFVL